VPAQSVNSVERAARLLDAMVEAGGASGVSPLAATTGLPYATVHRLLTALTACGYVRQEPGSRRYVLGPALVRLGETARQAFGWWAQPYLEELAELSGETANLAALDGDEVVYVAQAQSRQMMRMFTEVGNRVPVHSTAVGKVLLGFRTRPEIVALAKRRGLAAKTQHTITTVERLLEEVEKSRIAGYATDDEEAELGVQCVAVPVIGKDGREPIAAVSISGPVARLTPARRDAIVPEMIRLAKRMAEEAESGAAAHS
jgi:IclR family transcriptional regulator, acetate operon repressor